VAPGKRELVKESLSSPERRKNCGTGGNRCLPHRRKRDQLRRNDSESKRTEGIRGKRSGVVRETSKKETRAP